MSKAFIAVTRIYTNSFIIKHGSGFYYRKTADTHLNNFNTMNRDFATQFESKEEAESIVEECELALAEIIPTHNGKAIILVDLVSGDKPAITAKLLSLYREKYPKSLAGDVQVIELKNESVFNVIKNLTLTQDEKIQLIKSLSEDKK